MRAARALRFGVESAARRIRNGPHQLAASMVVACSLAASSAAAAEPARFTAFPIFGRQPETSWFLGGFLLLHFPSPGADAAPNAPPPRRSNVALAALYSLKSQFLLSLSPTVYLGGGRYRLRGELTALSFPDTFYAPGPDSPASSLEHYQQRSLGTLAIGEWRAVGSLYVGWQLHVATSALRDREAGRALASGSVPGSNGGSVVGAGPVLNWDDRDREGWPRRGGLYELSWTNYPRWLGGDFGTSALLLRLRRYVGLPADGALALELYYRGAAGSVPFQLLSALGGDGRMRGFLASRYVDRHVVSGQAEYRQPLFWRMAAAAFVGAGEVGPRPGAFDFRHVKFAGGPGLRFALNPDDGVYLRFDYGVSSDGDQNVYFLIGDAF